MTTPAGRRGLDQLRRIDALIEHADKALHSAKVSVRAGQWDRAERELQAVRIAAGGAERHIEHV